MREMSFLLHPLLPVTGERAGPRVRRERTTSALQQLPHTGELTPYNCCSSQNKGPCTSPGQNRTDPVGVSVSRAGSDLGA